MRYFHLLQSLDFRQSLAATEPTEKRVVLLTGQSSFESSRLHSEQCDFLRAVAPRGAHPLEAGFPFHPALQREAADPNLAGASVRNTMQFLWSLCSPRYGEVLARALQPVLDHTHEMLHVVTGSCGLQLLAAAWPHLAKPKDLRLRVVAVGPAMLRPSGVPYAAVQGRNDFLSRVLHRGPVHARCEAGHLDYWRCAQTRKLVASMLASE